SHSASRPSSRIGLSSKIRNPSSREINCAGMGRVTEILRLARRANHTGKYTTLAARVIAACQSFRVRARGLELQPRQLGLWAHFLKLLYHRLGQGPIRPGHGGIRILVDDRIADVAALCHTRIDGDFTQERYARVGGQIAAAAVPEDIVALAVLPDEIAHVLH